LPHFCGARFFAGSESAIINSNSVSALRITYARNVSWFELSSDFTRDLRNGRPGANKHRVIPKSRFAKLETIEDVIQKLIGI
jgi:hypothetical protein